MSVSAVDKLCVPDAQIFPLEETARTKCYTCLSLALLEAFINARNNIFFGSNSLLYTLSEKKSFIYITNLWLVYLIFFSLYKVPRSYSHLHDKEVQLIMVGRISLFVTLPIMWCGNHSEWRVSKQSAVGITVPIGCRRNHSDRATSEPFRQQLVGIVYLL